MPLDKEVADRFGRVEKQIRDWIDQILKTAKAVGDLKASIAEVQARRPANGHHRFSVPAWLTGSADAMA